MRFSFIKFVIVLALSSYVCGPLFETVDRWDNFPQKAEDIALSASSFVTFLAVAVAFAIALRHRMHLQPSFGAILVRPNCHIPAFSNNLLVSLPISSHSPPLILRI